MTDTYEAYAGSSRRLWVLVIPTGAEDEPVHDPGVGFSPTLAYLLKAHEEVMDDSGL